MKRDVLLSQARLLINGDRQEDYGTPQDNFKNIAERWSQHVGVEIHPWQVAVMMIDVKVARMATVGVPHEDSMIDIAGYTALAAELAE